MKKIPRTTINHILLNHKRITFSPRTVCFQLVVMDMHETEPWFHGKLCDAYDDTVEPREMADRLLTKNIHMGDGAFLVRESKTFNGDFSLSFLHNGRPQHCHIFCKYVVVQ